MKYIIFIFVAIMSIYDLNSQSCCASSACYVRLDDISNINTEQYQAELQDTVCKLAVVMLDYKDQFKVFDFGFYLYSEDFEEGFPTFGIGYTYVDNKNQTYSA
jgi:hypothetical protein